MPNWADVLREIAQTDPVEQASPFDIVRRKYLGQLSSYTNRNVIAYYSGWLQWPSVASTMVNDDDKNGFMLCCHGIDPKKGLDLILHTPGGGTYATASIIHYLRQIFGDNIRAIVPQIAMSAGTIIAISCQSILMGKQSNLGPVDPQLNGFPAQAVKAQFKQAYDDIINDPRTIPVWQTMISQLSFSFLKECDLAIEATEELALNVLKDNMLKDNLEMAKMVANKLSDLGINKSHEQHFHADYCKDIGLTIENLEEDQDLQDLVLTVHHCYMHALANTQSFKIIENQQGHTIIKHG